MKEIECIVKDIRYKPKSSAYQIEETRKKSTKSIGNGHFVDTGFNANTIVKHCREALVSAGYDIQKDLIIEIDEMKGK